ncbi:MAG TPA: glycoside hydrolase family 9 protein [Opitutaceae bacterium]|nr:glycoside hydrolase family 9 protein [Opitutaceae bacterium]
MIRFLSAVLGLFVTSFTLNLTTATARAVEDTWDYSVQVSSSVQASPARITLSWPQDTIAIPASYTIYRKAPGDTSWGSGVVLSGSATSYVDTSVAVGTAYEYRIVKAGSSFTGYGYIETGIATPLVENRGKLVLLVDNSVAASLASELARLQQDLVGDGWTVLRHDVGRTDSVPSVKALIKADYDADPANVKSVFLFGHIPVPYSGQLNPDGHPDHVGAWPADVYYGDVDGNWTDNSVNYVQTINTDPVDAARISNVPGDGKFDQTDIPSNVELQVGRVDLSNMAGRLSWGGPATFPGELELLRKYLNKDHNFRHRVTNAPRRAILGDYFGVRGGEAFAASGFRDFAPLVGASNIRNLNTEFNDQQGVWIPQVAASDYLLAYGCGAGSYTAISGIGSIGAYHMGDTVEMVNSNVRGVFNLLFGSWLGDWDHEDNMLRSPLATDYGLVSVWSGRPHWFIHPMGQGATIGAVTQMTQNNVNTYETAINSAAHRIHIALMGDPALRLHPVVPVSALNGTTNGGSVSLTWTASSDSAIVGYHVYRAGSAAGPFTRLTSAPIAGTNFTDASAPAASTYMVRAVKLEDTTSGSYYNPAQGVFWSMDGSTTATTTTSSPATTTGTTSNTPSPTTSSTSSAPATTSTSSSSTPAASTTTSATTTTSAANFALAWVDDALPTGATGMSNGDPWTWITSNPAPFSGVQAHQSALASGLHEHSFAWGTPLAVNSGEFLTTYVYLDPANPPSEIMLSWFADNWEHRAYWGANNISYGTDKTASRYAMGALPAAGQWVRLAVPASAVGLEGASVTGMSFSAYNGRVTWDASGKDVAATSPVPDTSASTSITLGNGTASATTAALTSTDTVWIDDALPARAISGGSGGDSWNWIAGNPTPFAGTKAHASAVAAGLHEHFFAWTTAPLNVATGEKLFAYVYLDPANLPTEIMLSWYTDSWEHRAFWGADKIGYGAKNTASRYNAGALPAAGQWVRLEVPASAVGLEGTAITGMSFSTNDGRAIWDSTGKATAGNSSSPTTTPSSGGTTTATTTPETIWFDDALPAGASAGTSGGDAWNWIAGNPAPFAGAQAHQSNLGSGLHEHYFAWGAGLSLATGEKLFAYVYLDPANPPSEIMLSWFADNWEHRAYWGANNISYGTDKTASRYSMGALPATGQWVRLEIPASAVGLEGQTVTGMSFSQFDGRATWDKTGKGGNSTSTSAGSGSTSTDTTSGGSTSSGGGTTSGGSTSSGGTTSGGTSSGGTTAGGTTTTPSTAFAENMATRLPQVGDNHLRILTPTMLELQRITTKDADPAPSPIWNFVDGNGNLAAPAASEFAVTVNGQSVAVKSIGFRRRVAYAPLNVRDLRIDNSLYVELVSPVSDGQAVEVKNPSGALWTADMKFAATADPLRYSPAIHVNQEGYVPSFPKKAIVGYYLGSKGELDVAAGAGFKIVNAATGIQVFAGTLTARADVGYTYSPTPYQKVLQADFSALTTPGEYQLVVSGVGASLPFLIDDGIAMGFLRTYELGIYHQRCGTDNALPYTRFVHDACHLLPAEVPSPQSSYQFTWTTIASKSGGNTTQTAPQLTSEDSQLYPFVNKGTVDVTGGHHDAGDYSKYTINVAQLVHELTFTADSIGGASNFDNLGIPESGDGISDILQEAKREADYLAKLQDADGGFYFIVYPKTREYEGGVTPDHGDQQVVWPKNTSASAAATAALAQIASSPKFKAAYPAEGAAYLAKAKAGWQFLMAAIAKYGKAGAYQKVTFYGDEWNHDDELAWAACEMYLATGDTQYQQKLFEFFPNPADPATFRWGWWKCCMSWGNAIRSYAFAARSGRLSAGQLDATYLATCEAQIKAAGDDSLRWSNQNAYGSSFPEETKHVLGAGWYFSLDQGSDMAVAYQLNPKPEYLDALVANMNYEGGTNPVNVTFLTGLGMKRQREIVSQYAQADRRVLPPDGIPLGNVQASFDYLWYYSASGNELSKLSFPSDDNNAAVKYPFYDRWADAYNVTTEFVTVNQSRALLALSAIASQTAAKSTPWKSGPAVQIVAPTTTVPVGAPLTLSFSAAGLDLTNARIVWEARDNEPDFGSTYTIVPQNNGAQWAEVEITWPDGRRVFGTATFQANSPIINYVDDAVPAGAITSTNGGDSWSWVTASPAAESGTKSHQSALAAGLHEHAFMNASNALVIGTGDRMFVYVYIDPANAPQTLMLSWNDGSSWEHRAYWGADKISYGTAGTPGHYNAGALPASGQWVKLEVPASAVGLEGKSVNGMSFSAFGGRVTWDAAGRSSTD